MLDIDGVNVPGGVSPVTSEAIQWFIKDRLPLEFQRATCYFQFSGSAGILNADGKPLKPGLRVHLFYYLDRRIAGKDLAAYLRMFCVSTGFYSVGLDGKNSVAVTYGIDPAPIRSSVQLHYIANPIVEQGVQSLLRAEDRSGFLDGEAEVVYLPEIQNNVVFMAKAQEKQLRDDWHKANGSVVEKLQIRTNTGVAMVQHYRLPTSAARLGRKLKDASPNGKFCTLYFEGEGSPGSWYVSKYQPQFGRRYGDGTVIPLKELSEDAYAYIKDGLRWFEEIPHVSLQLTSSGYVQPFDKFVHSKYSLVLAPTGSGKTQAMIDWVAVRSKSALVIYVAQTIPLVGQMYEDLQARGIDCEHYKSYHYRHSLSSGVFVTTNESLPRILKLLENEQLTAYDLIVDEFHVALDDFARSVKRFKTFTDAISRSRSSIFMTGTFTDLQSLMLTGTLSQLEGGALKVDRYCCYEFAPVKSNPLKLCELEDFDSDVVNLLERLKGDLEAKRPLPKVMLSVSSSKLQSYRNLLGGYGLLDQSYVVSRQEVDQGQIDEARIGDKPILVSSPLFSIGLNFTRQLEILYCRFDRIPTDTSRIIQTINRANRGDVACEVRIYAGATNSKPFYFPPRADIEEKIKAALAEEYSGGYSGTELPQIIDLMTYRHYREIESNSVQALGNLIQDEGFQNYQVIRNEDDLETIRVSPTLSRKDSKGKAKAAKRSASKYYDDRVLARLPSFVDDVVDIHFWRLQMLEEEARTAHRQEIERVPLDIADDTCAVLMNLCGIVDVKQGRMLNKRKLQSLFGDREPWLSDQFSASRFDGWAEVAAEKSTHLIPLLEVIKQLRSRDLDGFGFALKLNKDKRLQSSLRALVCSAGELVTLSGQFATLAELRELARTSGSKESKNAAQSYSLELTKDILEEVGVFFPVSGRGEERVIEFDKPMVPQDWDLDKMIDHLKRRAVLLDSLPKGLTKLGRTFNGRGLHWSPVSQCRKCRYFDAQCCALERHVDWSEEGHHGVAFESAFACEDFWPLPARLA